MTNLRSLGKYLGEGRGGIVIHLWWQSLNSSVLGQNFYLKEYSHKKRKSSVYEQKIAVLSKVYLKLAIIVFLGGTWFNTVKELPNKLLNVEKVKLIEVFT